MRVYPFLALLASVLTFSSAFGGECAWCEDTLVSPIAPPMAASGKIFSWSQGEAETNKVDVLVALDVSAQRWIQNNGYTIGGFVDEAIYELNSAIAQTGLDEYFMFRLAGIFKATNDMSDVSFQFMPTLLSGELGHVRYNGTLKSIRDARDEDAADIVVFLINPKSTIYTGNAHGLDASSLTKKGIVAQAKKACCVVDVKAVLTRQTMIHEVGHLFGAGHDNKQKTQPGPLLWSYSSGYRFSCGGQNYVTIMGYPSAATATQAEIVRLPVFSSPEYTFGGIPIGTKDKNDNTRTLRQTYAIVANYRVATLLPGYVPNDDEDDGPPEVELEPEVKALTLRVTRQNGDDVLFGDVLELTRYVPDGFSMAASASGGEKVTTKVTGLPTGLKFMAKTGAVSGAPKKPGTYAVKVTVKCKGYETLTQGLTLSVADVPGWLTGESQGIIDDGGVVSLGVFKISTNGKVTLKRTIQGSSRTLSCQGFAKDGAEFLAEPTVKVKKVPFMSSVRVSSTQSTLVSGGNGTLLPNPWTHSGMACPTIQKAIKTTWSGLTVAISRKGKVRFSGKLNGVRVSGTFQVVAQFDENGAAHWRIPVLFNAKKNFDGWFGMLSVDFSADGKSAIVRGG